MRLAALCRCGRCGGPRIPQGSKARIRILWEMGVKKKKKAIYNIDLFYLLYIYTLYIKIKSYGLSTDYGLIEHS